MKLRAGFAPALAGLSAALWLLLAACGRPRPKPAAASPSGAVTEVEVDAENLRNLEALGYVQ